MKKIIRKVIVTMVMASTMVTMLWTSPPGRNAEAASDGLSFDQQIKANDVTDGSHISGITTPNFKVEYRLDPILNVNSNDKRYETDLANYPVGSVKDATGVINYTKEIAPKITDASGIASEEISANDIFNGKKFAENSKVYRYNVSIVGLYVKENDTTWSSSNLLNSPDSGIVVPHITPIMDVSIDSDGKIAQIAMWDSSGTSKTSGFVARNSSGNGNPFITTVYADDGSGAIEYNTNDVVITSDYIGGNWDSIHGGISYSVTFTNLPYYLVSSDAVFESLIVGTNARSWKAKSGNTTTNATAEGTLDQTDEITFHGIPAVDGAGKKVTYSSTIHFENLDKDESLKKQYASAIFYGAVADRISSVSSLAEFASSGQSVGYDNNAYKQGEDYRTIGASEVSATSVNANRFVIFDPDQLVVVGVVKNSAPAVFMIIAGILILMLLLIGRRHEDNYHFKRR